MAKKQTQKQTLKVGDYVECQHGCVGVVCALPEDDREGVTVNYFDLLTPPKERYSHCGQLRYAHIDNLTRLIRG